jgi:chitin deacetylase
MGKFILLKKLVVLILLLIVVLFIGFKISKSRTFQFFGGIIRAVETDKKIVALTFDDGPTKENTDMVLEILKEVDVKTTFFVIGKDLEENMEEGKRIVAAGHELANHTYSHNRMVLKTPTFIKDEIEKTDELIRQAGYKDEIQFRPPNGKKLIILPYYLKKTNRKTILWNLEPDSYPEIATSSDKIATNVSHNIEPGSIILLHVMYKNRSESVDAIKKIVIDLKAKGYEFRTVSQLLKE